VNDNDRKKTTSVDKIFFMFFDNMGLKDVIKGKYVGVKG
jgi:hypothetical protein